jgi:hypothetical protein
MHRNPNAIKKELQQITETLRDRWNPHSIILFGSASRGDYSGSSDLDLLLITEQKVQPSAVRASVSIYAQKFNMSFSVYQKGDFVRLFDDGSLFVAHILQEGVVLHDDGQFGKLREKPFRISTASLMTSCSIIRNNLSIYSDLSIFNELYSPSLAHLYSMAADLAMIGCALEGKAEFRKVRALQRIGEKIATLRPEIALLSSLQPIWLSSKRGLYADRSPLRLDRDGVHNCVNAVKQLSDVVMSFAKNR